MMLVDMKLNQQGDREMKECIYNEDDRLYLQMLQSNIKRMNKNSSNCKIWTIALATTFLALNLNGVDYHADCMLSAVSTISVLVLWYLDGLYLKYERGFRNRETEFLNNIETEKYEEMLFNFKPLMAAENKNKGFVSTKSTYYSKSVISFYPIIILFMVLVRNYFD